MVFQSGKLVTRVRYPHPILTTTDALGQYQFDALVTGSYVVTPMRQVGVNFEPFSQSVNVDQDIELPPFVASVAFPVRIGNYNDDWSTRSVAVSGDFAYVTGAGSGFFG